MKTEMIIKGKVVSTRLRIKTLEGLKKELNEELKSAKGKEAKEIKDQLSFIQMIIEDKEDSNKIPDFKKEKESKNEKKEEPKEEKEKKPKLARTKTQISKPVTDLPDDLLTLDDEDEDHAIKASIYDLSKMSEEVRESIVYLDRKQLRTIVDQYQQFQAVRIASENQLRAYKQGYDGEGNKVSAVEWVAVSARNTEENIKKMMETYAQSNPVTRWLSDIVGIGPVISTSLYAYFDAENVHHSGNFWSYAGLNNNNNPWYGTVKSAKMMAELVSIRDIKIKAFKKACKDLSITIPDSIASKSKFNEDLIESKITKILGEDKISEICSTAREIALPDLKEIKQIGYVSDMDTSDMTVEEMIEYDCVEDPGYGLISFDREFFMDDFIDYLFYLSNKAVMSNAMLMMVYEKTNQHRKISTIRKASTIDKAGDSHEGLITKDSLQKYLSKPPYNAKLKVLMWKIGDSFIKKKGNPKSLYGRIYTDKLAELIAKNEAGGFKHNAALALKRKNYGKNTESYKAYIQGKLPMSQLIAMARRFAEKVFLDHVFREMYMYVHHKMPSYPYPITFQGHTDFIGPEVPFDKYFDFEIDWTPDNMKMA